MNMQELSHGILKGVGQERPDVERVLQLFPACIALNDSSELFVRLAQKTDAEALIGYVKQVAGETDFLTFSPQDFNKTVDEEAAILEAYLKAPNQVFLVAELQGEIVAALDVSSSMKPRLMHLGELGVSVKEAHWGKGIGGGLMRLAILWAKQIGLRKINLKVDKRNTRAIGLYEKCGFEIEGECKRDGLIDGEFRDSYCMGLLID